MSLSKKIMYITLAIFVGSIIAVVIRAKTWINEIKYGIAEGVKLKKVSLSIVQLYLPIWVYNPTPFNVIASNLDLKVYLNGYYVSRVMSPSNYALKPKENSTYPIDLNIDVSTVVKLLAEKGILINDPNWLDNVNVTIEGSVSVDLGIIKIKKLPINITENLKYYLG